MLRSKSWTSVSSSVWCFKTMPRRIWGAIRSNGNCRNGVVPIEELPNLVDVPNHFPEIPCFARRYSLRFYLLRDQLQPYAFVSVASNTKCKCKSVVFLTSQAVFRESQSPLRILESASIAISLSRGVYYFSLQSAISVSLEINMSVLHKSNSDYNSFILCIRPCKVNNF